MRHHSIAILCACLMLAACGTDKTATPQQQAGAEGLPLPDAAGGSVTGMPNPGAPSPPPADDLATESEGAGFATDDANGVEPDFPMTAPEPGNMGEVAIPPPETMPTMPAPVEDPIESRIAPPAES